MSNSKMNKHEVANLGKATRQKNRRETAEETEMFEKEQREQAKQKQTSLLNRRELRQINRDLAEILKAHTFCTVMLPQVNYSRLRKKRSHQEQPDIDQQYMILERFCDRLHEYVGAYVSLNQELQLDEVIKLYRTNVKVVIREGDDPLDASFVQRRINRIYVGLVETINKQLAV